MLIYKWNLLNKKWQITNNNGLTYQLPNHKGMKYLTTLLNNQSKPVPYLSLVYDGLYNDINIEFKNDPQLELIRYGLHEECWFPAFPKADRKTIHQVYNELILVRKKIEKTRINNDVGMAEMYEEELGKLTDYLKSICSQTKKIRNFDNGFELLRRSICKSIYRVLLLIRDRDRKLESLFKSHIEYENNRILLYEIHDVEICVSSDSNVSQDNHTLAR